jgi:hypothetical protein
MEPDGSLQCLQVSILSQLSLTQTIVPYSFKVHFNIILSELLFLTKRKFWASLIIPSVQMGDSTSPVFIYFLCLYNI